MSHNLFLKQHFVLVNIISQKPGYTPKPGDKMFIYSVYKI